MEETYKIIRVYFDDRKNRTIAKGVSLEQAKKHCNDPKTSSSTHPKGRNGCTCDWFDGFIKE